MKAILFTMLGLVIIAGSVAYLTIQHVYGYGTLCAMMTDPPREWGYASNIYIHYGEVMVHRAEAGNGTGWYKVADEGWINLLSVVNMSKVVGNTNLQAGKYNLVRFQIKDAIVTVDGVNYTATVPPEKLTITITKGGVQVNTGQTSYLLIDINPKVTGSKTSGFKLVPAATASPT
ncbi:MAG: DUF4382 domain-containing protein [Candidatus Bathyarchaeota archaeon]